MFIHAWMLVVSLCWNPYSLEPVSVGYSLGSAQLTAQQEMVGMEEMAASMKSMADMCRLMMDREMQARPLKIAAVAIVGSLLAFALLLLIWLEIQCIRLLGQKIRAGVRAQQYSDANSQSDSR